MKLFGGVVIFVVHFLFLMSRYESVLVFRWCLSLLWHWLKSAVCSSWTHVAAVMWLCVMLVRWFGRREALPITDNWRSTSDAPKNPVYNEPRQLSAVGETYTHYIYTSAPTCNGLEKRGRNDVVGVKKVGNFYINYTIYETDSNISRKSFHKL